MSCFLCPCHCWCEGHLPGVRPPAPGQGGHVRTVVVFIRPPGCVHVQPERLMSKSQPSPSRQGRMSHHCFVRMIRAAGDKRAGQSHSPGTAVGEAWGTREGSRRQSGRPGLPGRRGPTGGWGGRRPQGLEEATLCALMCPHHPQAHGDRRASLAQTPVTREAWDPTAVLVPGAKSSNSAAPGAGTDGKRL